jgi:fimbrial chaperone protein
LEKREAFMQFVRLFLFTLTIVGLTATAAQAKIDLVPRKVIIDGRSRTGEVIILNLGNEPSTFRIGLVNYKQDEKGIYQELQGPLNPVFDPEKIVRLSPRQFTLPVGGRQKIRFSIRPPADLPKGEYHFHISALELAGQGSENETARGKQITVRMNVGVSIPVIYRHGELSGEAKLSNLTLVSSDRTESKAPELQMRITRKGDAGAIGNLSVMWETAGQPPQQIGVITNMNLFTEINYRDVPVPLSMMPTGPGILRVRYTEDAGVNKGRVFDEVVLQR